MGNNLTWQNVAAPDFGTSIEGLRTFSHLLGGAFDKVGSGVEAFDRANADRASNAVQLALAQAPDAAAAQKLIASGQIGGRDLSQLIATNHLNPDAMGAIQKTPDALIARAVQQQGLSDAQIKAQQKAVFDANSEAYAHGLALTRSNVPADQEAGRAIIDHLNTKGMSAADITGLNSTVQNTAANQIADADSRFRYGVQGRDDALTTQAAAIKAELEANGARPDDYAVLLPGILARPEYQGPNSGRLLSTLQSMMGQAGATGGAPGIPSGGAGSPLAGPSTGPTGWDSIYGNGKYLAAPDTPLSQGTFGDALAYGERQRQATAGKIGAGDKGTSAVGGLQILASTLNGKTGSDGYGQKVLGANWRTQGFGPENQARIGEAIFNDYKDGDLTTQWPSLLKTVGPQAAQPGFFKGKSFADVKGLILAGEANGAVPDAARVVARAAGVDAMQNSQAVKDDPTGFLARAQAVAEAQAAKGVRLGGDVAKEFGAKRGISTDQAQRVIDLVMAEAARRGVKDMTPELAVAVLESSQRAETGVERLARHLPDHLGKVGKFLQFLNGTENAKDTGLVADDAGIKAKIGQIANGDVAAFAMTSNLRKTLQATTQGSSVGVEAAHQRYLQAVADQAARPTAQGPQLVQHWKEAYERAAGMAGAAQNAGYNDAGNRSTVIPVINNAITIARGSGMTPAEQTRLDGMLKQGMDPTAAAQEILHPAAPPKVVATTRAAVKPQTPPATSRAPSTGSGAASPPRSNGGGILETLSNVRAQNRAANIARDAKLSALTSQLRTARANGDHVAVQRIRSQIDSLV